MPRRITGHERRAVPLSPVLGYRRSPKDGWRMECVCGWSTGPFRIRAEADRSYSDHVTSSLPVCGSCGGSHPRSSMSKGSPHLCKECAKAKLAAWIAQHPSEYERSRRKSHLKNKYGITPEAFDALLAAQGHRCAICEEPPEDARGFRPHVDHCHTTGRVRGILCGRCNKALGQFKDSVALLRAALAYLEQKA